MKRLSAGLVDAGASSLATLLAGVVAARLLPSNSLGAYALFFAAWVLAVQVPSQLLLVPAEAKLVASPVNERASALFKNVYLATPFALIGSVIVFGVILIAPTDVGRAANQELAATSSLVAFLFPFQDHARRLFHLGRRHWEAAGVSIVRLVATSIAIAVGISMEVSPTLLPFGSLLVGDLCALGLSLVFASQHARIGPTYELRDLLGSGRWLLVAASWGPAAGFVVSFLVTRLADAAALGLAEAARVAAQPVLVLAMGLAAVFRPSSMEAAVSGDEPAARSLSARLAIVLAGGTLFYLAVAALPGSTGPMHTLLPTAFAVPGLFEVSVAAAFANGAVLLHRSEFIALEESRHLSSIEAWSSLGRVSVGALSARLMWWTVPIGFLIGGVLRWVLMSRALSRGYRFDPDETGR